MGVGGIWTPPPTRTGADLLRGALPRVPAAPPPRPEDARCCAAVPRPRGGRHPRAALAPAAPLVTADRRLSSARRHVPVRRSAHGREVNSNGRQSLGGRGCGTRGRQRGTGLWSRTSPDGGGLGVCRGHDFLRSGGPPAIPGTGATGPNGGPPAHSEAARDRTLRQISGSTGKSSSAAAPPRPPPNTPPSPPPPPRGMY